MANLLLCKARVGAVAVKAAVFCSIAKKTKSSGIFENCLIVVVEAIDIIIVQLFLSSEIRNMKEHKKRPTLLMMS
jgi:hypothetical protein